MNICQGMASIGTNKGLVLANIYFGKRASSYITADYNSIWG